MAKITKTPNTNSKTNGTVSEPAKPAITKTEPVKVAATKAEPIRTPAPARPEPAKPIAVQVAPAKTTAPQPNISLELVKPGAKQVAVAGSFNDWKPERAPLVQIGNGRWVGDLNVKPGRHESLYVVDGQWVPDPNARENVQNPFGGKNSVLIVSA